MESPKHAASANAVETRATLVATVAVVAGFVVALLVLWGDRHPLAGDGSVGNAAAAIAGCATAVSFAVSYGLKLHRDPSRTRGWAPETRRVLALVPLAVATGAIAYLGVISASEIFQSSFIGLDLDAFAGALLAAVASGVGAYVVHPLGEAISTATLGTLLVVFLVVGTVFSMLTASDPEWWKLHFSQLGADPTSAPAFNVTLILSGLIVVTIGWYVGQDIRVWSEHRGVDRAVWVGRLLTLMGVLLAGVGFVSTTENEPIHIMFASGMVVVFATLSIGLPWFAPGLPREFHIVTGAILAAIVGALLLWVPLDYYNLTGFEFAAAGLLFVWLTVFVRRVAALAADARAAAATSETPVVASPSPSQMEA